MSKVMKLINPYTGEMECKVCGGTHFSAIEPGTGGRFKRGCWQCSWEGRPTNRKFWDVAKQRFVRVTLSEELAKMNA